MENVEKAAMKKSMERAPSNNNSSRCDCEMQNNNNQ